MKKKNYRPSVRGNSDSKNNKIIIKIINKKIRKKLPAKGKARGNSDIENKI